MVAQRFGDFAAVTGLARMTVLGVVSCTGRSAMALRLSVALVLAWCSAVHLVEVEQIYGAMVEA